jgi:cytoskeletal protein CcmA (bactofilin family)
MNQSDFKQLNFSFLGRENFLKGEFKLHGDMVVNCQLEGTITATGDSKITFDRDSQFDGTIYCHDLEIYGKISGQINATGSVTLRASAELSGKISAKSFRVYPGAVLNIEGNTTTEESQETL